MSQFLQKMEEENKSGKPIDDVMEEEDDDDEENEEVADLGEVQDGIGAIHINNANQPGKFDGHAIAEGEEVTHKFNAPKPAAPWCGKSTKWDPSLWSEYFDTMDKIDGVAPCYYAGDTGHVFLCLHGAGHSALSFAALAKILKQEPYNSTCVSFDFRGHGGHTHVEEALLS